MFVFLRVLFDGFGGSENTRHLLHCGFSPYRVGDSERGQGMTEEQKALFMKEAKRLSLELMGLAMEFPGTLIDITVDDSGYFASTVMTQKEIYRTYKTAGHKQGFDVIEMEEKA